MALLFGAECCTVFEVVVAVVAVAVAFAFVWPFGAVGAAVFNIINAQSTAEATAAAGRPLLGVVLRRRVVGPATTATAASALSSSPIAVAVCGYVLRCWWLRFSERFLCLVWLSLLDGTR